jgi:hypothetical protein
MLKRALLMIPLGFYLSHAWIYAHDHVGDVWPCNSSKLSYDGRVWCHTFRLINEAGESCFVKFHWKPKLGTHAVAWDEAKKFQERILIFTERIYGKQLKLEFSGMGIRCTK